MKQFFQGTREAFANLARAADNTCVIFRNQEMPTGASPQTARIGIEGAGGGTLHLLVERGVSFGGDHEDVRRWLSDGVRSFDSPEEMRLWLTEVLAPCYRPQAMPPVTDIGEVRRRLTQQPPPRVQVSEETLLTRLAERVKGQDAALRSLARRTCLHLRQTAPARPCTFFAVGPTGVGKTSLAESLPLALRGTPHRTDYGFLRLDMSEYQERHRVSQLIGAPQGYLGYGEGAVLADHLADHPRSIILFDEIEKAHRDVLMLLMNAIDAGRITRSSNTAGGRQVDCREAIFIFTSNLDAEAILAELESQEGFEDPHVTNRICRERLLRAGIRPEIIGRIGSFLVFRPLDDATRAEVVTLSIQRVAARYGLEVATIEPDVIVSLFEQSRSDGFGARPVEYLIDDLLGPSFASFQNSELPARINISGPPYEVRDSDAAA